jgi:hypothetical protein
MSCNGVVIKTLDGGEICIPLYVDIRKLRDLIPDPDPDPRIKVFEDLRTLAIVNEVVGRISDRRIAETLSRSVLDAAQGLSFPEGVQMGDGLFSGQSARDMPMREF